MLEPARRSCGCGHSAFARFVIREATLGAKLECWCRRARPRRRRRVRVGRLRTPLGAVVRKPPGGQGDGRADLSTSRFAAYP